ncbi:MAG: bifunctional metallophosphatase/5'-nucleotidase [Phycisphaeraceae bacterium]
MKRFRGKAITTLALVAAFGASTAQAQFSITVLHNNDGESGLFDSGGIGGVAKYKTMFDATKSFYQSQGHGVVSVYAGDSFLAGPQFQASLDSGAPGGRTFYDALAISRIGYDASILGNHEFDFGPEVLAEFIGDAQTTNPTTYLSANLDFTGEPALNALVGSGTIAPSTMVTVPTAAGSKNVGIIGATTENLPFISTTGNVGVHAVAAAIDAEVAALNAAGADVIILGSHLQGLSEDQALVPLLNATSQTSIDLIIAGGGDELLASNVGNPAFSPTTAFGAAAPLSVADTGVNGGSVEGAYPDAGAGIPIVTTTDQYEFLGRVTLNFDVAGNFTGVYPTSNPQLNDASFAPDPDIAADIAPVQTFVNGLSATNIGTSSVRLLHGGSNTIRSQETNLGDLVADAQRAAALAGAASQGVVLTANRTVGIANGGGIREDIEITDANANAISRLDTFNVSPFGNFVSITEDVTVADFLLTLENAVSRVVDGDPGPGIDPQRQGSGTGRFAQVSGFSFVYDITEPALVLDGDGNVLSAGSRIVEITLEDGTVLVQNGQIVAANAGILLDLILPNFNALGGDQYLDRDYLSQDYSGQQTQLPITDQQALEDYISSFGNADLATVLGGEYANVNGAGRIVVIPEPTSLALLALGGLLVARRRRG